MPVDVDGEWPVGVGRRERYRQNTTPAADEARQHVPQGGMVGYELGEIQLGDVDPPLLGQLDEHGDEDRHRHDRQRRQPPGSSVADRLVGDEVVPNVFGKTNSSHRWSSNSNNVTPTRRYR
jgi:hypothetical protein